MDDFQVIFDGYDYKIGEMLREALTNRDLERAKSKWINALWAKCMQKIIDIHNDDVLPAASRKYFNPVSCRWQKRICAKFGIGVKSSLPTGHFKVLAKPTKRVHAKMDGNCFYRSLSVWVTGDQSAHALLRQELVKFMSTDTRVRDFLGGETNRQSYIATAKVGKAGEWATEVEIIAAAFMLNTTIMVYCCHANQWLWQMFHKSGLYPDAPHKYEACIYLTNTNRNHFDAVIDVKYKPDYRRTTDELYLSMFVLKDVFKICFKKNFESVLPVKPIDLESILQDRVLFIHSLHLEKRSTEVKKNTKRRLTSDLRLNFAEFENNSKRGVKNVLEWRGDEVSGKLSEQKLVAAKGAAKKSFWKRTKRFLKRFVCCGGKRPDDDSY